MSLGSIPGSGDVYPFGFKSISPGTPVFVLHLKIKMTSLVYFCSFIEGPSESSACTLNKVIYLLNIRQTRFIIQGLIETKLSHLTNTQGVVEFTVIFTNAFVALLPF